MEEAGEGLGGGAEAVLGPGPAPVSALAWPDPPSERRTAARHAVGPVRSPRILILETIQRLRAVARKPVFVHRLLGISLP